MASAKKYIDHAHDVLGMDRSASPNIAPQGKWFTCEDVRFRDLRMETFPGMRLRYDVASTLGMDYFEASQEDQESFCWFGISKAFYSYSSNPNNVMPALIINRDGSFPADSGNTAYMCALTGVGSALGIGTLGPTTSITVTIGANGMGLSYPTTFTVTDGTNTTNALPIQASTVITGTAMNANGPGSANPLVSFTINFVPSSVDDTFDNYIATTAFQFNQGYAFANATVSNQVLRPQVVKWWNVTYITRGTQQYQRQNNVYFPLMYNQMLSQTFQSAMYTEVYQRHLLLAGGIAPSSIFWSQLNDFNNYLPTLFNESDVYEILRYNHIEVNNLFITGVRNLGVYCYVYTPETIWRMIYVGLPNVMFLQEVSTPTGSQFAYGLVAAGKMHYFISAANFYMFDGNAPVSIGDPIKLFFFSDLTTNRVLQNKTWGFYNIRSEEVMWFYCDITSNGNINKCLYFHIPTKAWYYRNVPNVVWAYDMFFTNNLVDVQGQQQPLPGDLFYYVPEIGVVSDVLPYEEATPFENFAPQNPLLESNDFIYNSPLYYKDVDTLYFDTAYNGTVDINTAFREYISSPVVFTLAQAWTSSTPTGRASLPRGSGRVFRYQFVFIPNANGLVTRSRIYTWGENAEVTQAEQ